MLVLKRSSMLEAKLVSYLFLFLGVPIALLGIIANIDTWKANVLFVMSGILIGAKIVYFIVDKDQQRKKKNMELEDQRHTLNKKKKTE